jgi:hypothetical protein
MTCSVFLRFTAGSPPPEDGACCPGEVSPRAGEAGVLLCWCSMYALCPLYWARPMEGDKVRLCFPYFIVLERPVPEVRPLSVFVGLKLLLDPG